VLYLNVIKYLFLCCLNVSGVVRRPLTVCQLNQLITFPKINFLYKCGIFEQDLVPVFRRSLILRLQLNLFALTLYKDTTALTSLQAGKERVEAG
jgi:hypothetical protein